MSTTRETLGKVASLRDDLGILSLYVDADPGAQASRPTGWEVVVKNELAALVAQVGEREPRERAVRIRAALEELDGEIERAVHPTTHGRGRVLFAALGSGEQVRLEFQLPTETRVVLDATAFIRPLVAAYEQGRPAGLVTLSRSGVVVYGWELGAVDEVEQWSIDVETSEWRRMKGPAKANPAVAKQTAPQHDRFERRLEEHHASLIADVGAELDQLRAKRGWRRLVVAGDPRLRSALVSGLPAAAGAQVVEIDRKLEKLSPTELGAHLLPDLDAARAAERVGLAARADELARGGGAATTGIRSTLAALAEGRVNELLIERGRDYTGVRAADGTLYAERGSAVGVADAALVDEPRLGERMIERALATDADVVTLDPDEVGPLAEADGVGALLRW